VQKFPVIYNDIGSEHRDRRFAILIDEAHSSQGGKAAAALNVALSGGSDDDDDEDESVEDKINAIMESRKMLENANYFAFTATPKNKTLEIFGEPFPQGDAVKHRPFPHLHDEAGDR
jgi:type I restriction enzyme R subunit